MSLVTPYIQKLQKIRQAIPTVITRSLLDNTELIVEVLKKRQLSKGLDASGDIVGRYSEGTQRYVDDPHTRPRNENKSAGNPYNFEWYGELYDSLNMKVNAQTMKFEIFSTTGKDVFLEKIYDTDLTTLMKGNEQFVIDTFIEPAIIEYINTEMSKL